MNSRKSSPVLKLALMGTTAIVLAGCDTEPRQDGKLYQTPNQCEMDGTFTDSQCYESYQAAVAQHEETAPKYNSETLCTDQHGRNTCYPVQRNSGSFWSPFLTGYFVSSAIQRVTGNSRSDWDYYVRPIYRNRHDNKALYTATGEPIRQSASGSWGVRADAMQTTPKAATKVQTRSTVVARGGFGSRFSGRSFGG